MGVDKESNKNDIKGWRAVKKSGCIFSVTRSLFLFTFSWGSDNTIASNKKSTSKKEPTSAPEITIYYWHKNIVIPLLCQCGLFLHTCASKNSVLPIDVIFYLFWYNMIRWSSHICKKFSFLSYYSFLVKLK